MKMALSRKIADAKQESSLGKALFLSLPNGFSVTLRLMLVYVLCWLPYNVLSLWMMLDKRPGSNVVQEKLYFLNGLIVLNSVINPFIYGRFKATHAPPRAPNEIKKEKLATLGNRTRKTRIKANKTSSN